MLSQRQGDWAGPMMASRDSKSTRGQRDVIEPRLQLVAWEITRSCNLFCAHCRASAARGPYEDELSTEECFHLIDEILEVGQVETYRFVNPTGLQSIGENLYKVTNASGEAMPGRPGFEGMGKVLHKFLEMSNVSVVQEMVNMIVAQRAYELNSRAIQTSDTMLGIANGLKR